MGILKDENLADNLSKSNYLNHSIIRILHIFQTSTHILPNPGSASVKAIDSVLQGINVKKPSNAKKNKKLININLKKDIYNIIQNFINKYFYNVFAQLQDIDCNENTRYILALSIILLC